MRPLRLCGLLGVLLALSPGLAAAAEPPAPATSPAQTETSAEVLKRANELLVANKFSEAEEELHRAEALAGGQCGECALGVATVRASEGKWSESADLIQRALPQLTSPAALSRAYNQLGMAYVRMGGAENLTKAEEAMRSAADYPGAWGNIAHVNLAQVLFLEGRWADTVPAAREGLEKVANDPDMSKAARIILCQARSHLPEELPLQAGEAPLKVAGGITPPEKISGIFPVYTEAARKAGREGVVIVESIIDAEGCVRRAKVLQGQPDGLSEAALEAIRLWVYSPARYQEKPVAVYNSLSINFKVSSDPPKPAAAAPPPQR